MASRRRAARAPRARVQAPRAPTVAPLDLDDVAAALTDAVVGARRRLAAEVEDASAIDPMLGRVIPALMIAEARLSIRFIVQEAERSADKRGGARVRVRVDEAALREAAPHLVSELELRITPTTTSAATQPPSDAGG